MLRTSSDAADFDAMRAIILEKRPELAKGNRIPWGGKDTSDAFTQRRFFRASKGKDRVEKAAANYLSYLEWRDQEKVGTEAPVGSTCSTHLLFALHANGCSTWLWMPTPHLLHSLHPLH